ncbi:hypothetical protein SAMN05443574_101310 [Haloarcula vallismortis]|uniref:Uncharacterized protein n=2 Tax=Haloarcula vallismortis TaxID=28442 RepID=M0IYL7_HALVA|nr:hypothetical protein [Haloarcula vallismortis]EMA00884.1 hypothetical protein C437_18837 [Haloarcula vallismortis ATCC 29715]SDW08692.1 hypothetical protein SAMN05443574_101310 [Haloarcula vallismortis]
MRRRRFLASGATLLSVAVAGCGHPAVVLDMDDATAADIADEVSMSPDPTSAEHTVVSAAIENGTATRRGRNELFDQIDTVRIDETFYDVSETPLESNEVTVYEVRIDFDPADSTPEIGAVDYEELPEADRQRLDPIISDDNPPSGDGYDVGVGYGTAEEVGDGSVFVPEQQYDIIVHDGDRYRLTVSTRTTTETEYRYEVTEVASGVDSFADQIRDRYLFTLTGLSEAEREVVEEAIDGGYFQDDKAFRSVTDRIREHDGIEVTDSYGTWLLSYEQVDYLTYVEW